MVRFSSRLVAYPRSTLVAPALLTLAALAAVASCSAPDTDSAPTQPPSQAEGTSSEAAQSLSRLRADFGAETFRDGEAEELTATASALAPRFARAQADVALPREANADARVADQGSGVAVRFRLEGARAAVGSVASGLVVYPGAGPDGGDVVQRPTAAGTEDYVVIQRRPSAPELRYSFQPEQASGLRLVANTLELLDERSVPRLRVASPYLVDANQRRQEISLAVEGCAVDTGPAATWRRSHDAKPLASGSSCTLVVRWDGDVAYPIVVDPAWTTTASMAHARRRHTATLLADEAGVLIAGGVDSAGDPVAALELYDIANNVFVSAGASLAAARSGHTATLMTDGSVLFVGGVDATPSPLAQTEIFDPSTAQMVVGAASLAQARQRHVAVRLEDGKVLVAGGGTQVAELIAADGKSVAPAAGGLTDLRSGAVAALVPGSKKVLIAGGKNATAVVNTAEIFDPDAGTFTKLGPTMNTVRQSATITTVHKDDKDLLLIAGGDNGTLAFASADTFDPASQTFTQVSGPMVQFRTRHAAARLPSGQVVLFGGFAGDQHIDDPARLFGIDHESAEAYDPRTSSFITLKDELPIGLEEATATALPNHKILLVGGGSGPTAAQSEAYLTERQLGEACATADECVAGAACVAGKGANAGRSICCSSLCSGDCVSCFASDQGDGGAGDGYCGNLPKGTNVGTICLAQFASIIGRTCDENGNPSFDSSTAATECSPASCTGADGAGVCRTSCDPANPATCAVDGFCNSATQKCEKKGKAGESFACQNDTECLEGNCVDGFCCNTSCEGQCQACDVPDDNGTKGMCTVVVGAPHGERAACGGAGTPCEGRCDGKLQETCTYPGAETACGDQSCEGTTLTHESCGANGVCNSKQDSCGNYSCAEGGKACNETCTSDSDCNNDNDKLKLICVKDDPFGAASSEGQCVVVQAATCQDHTVFSNNQEPKDCSPYKCNDTACLTQCTSARDCVAPSVCDASGACVAPVAPSDVSAIGCSFSPDASSSGSRGLGVVALVGAAAVFLRRRRR